MEKQTELLADIGVNRPNTAETEMPGTLESFEVLVFDDREGEISLSDRPLSIKTADEARALASRLARGHAGTAVVSRRGNTAIGEAGPALVLEQHGRIGDFD
ncbi:hypothetical protein C8J36_101934 [Rhizobium sp. PP-F2F-G48]|uniref:hypothetical protein n=1 Tax=Rhizobium sp. PP-F2F-G48 TaxID=2135651 RepID=UPI00104A7290|nr:hypothetical protein [Rhizobium sp. PP-F2F-G48]TCM59022.1 hypothetical protein C8J36_101934 [Rhizobium sp. PP-F2F-G48]